MLAPREMAIHLGDGSSMTVNSCRVVGRGSWLALQVDGVTQKVDIDLRSYDGHITIGYFKHALTIDEMRELVEVLNKGLPRRLAVNCARRLTCIVLDTDMEIDMLDSRIFTARVFQNSCGIETVLKEMFKVAEGWGNFFHPGRFHLSLRWPRDELAPRLLGTCCSEPAPSEHGLCEICERREARFACQRCAARVCGNPKCWLEVTKECARCVGRGRESAASSSPAPSEPVPGSLELLGSSEPATGSLELPGSSEPAPGSLELLGACLEFDLDRWLLL